MSTATRRDVRQAVALATELNLFSVTLHGVTWTLYHPGRQPRPGPQSANRDNGKNAATSRRSERSAARLRDFQAAQRFRLAHVFLRWKQLNQMQPPQMLPPARTFAAVVKACRNAGSSGAAAQQQQEQMAIGDRSKRAVPSSPVASSACGASGTSAGSKRKAALATPERPQADGTAVVSVPVIAPPPCAAINGLRRVKPGGAGCHKDVRQSTGKRY